MRTLGGRTTRLGRGLGLTALTALIAIPALSGCGTSTTNNNSIAAGVDSVGGDSIGGSDSAGGDSTTIAATPVIDLVVDANRDGVAKASDPADQDNETVHSDAFGAIFLPNLDDDDNDRVEDFFDLNEVNAEDAKDFAPIQLQAWKNAPEGTVAKLSVEPADKVRVWGKIGGSWALLAGSFDTCDTASNCNPTGEVPLSLDLLRSGVELGIEGREFDMDSATGWNGIATVKLSVVDKDGKPVVTKDAADGTDSVSLEIARWMLNGNVSTFDNMWSMKWGSTSNAAPFNKDLTASTTAQGKVTYTTYSNWADQWTQDFFQSGIVQMPAADGKVQGMRVFNARPWGRDPGVKNLPITWLRNNYLGQDKAILATYKKAETGGTYDSHGNHDLLPPYTKGAESFPYGRIITGSGVLPETWAFYNAQKAQGPTLVVDTTWLCVGHVDETISYAPAATPRGWKLLVADDKMAKKMFEDVDKSGKPNVVFPGRNGYVGDKYQSMEQTAADILKNADVLQASQEAAIATAGQVDTVKKAVGLTDDELFSMPFLTENISEFGGTCKLAYQPGTVNSMIMYNEVFSPKPFSLVVDGKDVFETDLTTRFNDPANKMGADGKGMKVNFIDNWYGYHINMGEVHCGTNPEMAPNPALKPWTIKH
jgi:protein-arginine deiminase